MIDFWEDYGGYIKFLLFVLIAISAVTILVVELFHAECVAMTTDIGMESRWSILGGCQVHDGGRWIPLANWRVFD